MKKFTLVASVAVVAALLAVSGAIAGDAKKDEAKVQSWTGEIVDMGCYLGHGAMGEKHAECGLKCVADGMPMGLLTEGNKVLLLTPSHDNGDPYVAAKEWVSKQVKVTGKMMTRGGMQAIEVSAAEPAAEPAKKAKS
jgi:hypothetical protein